MPSAPRSGLRLALQRMSMVAALLAAVALALFATRYRQAPGAQCIATPPQVVEVMQPGQAAAPGPALARYQFRFELPTVPAARLALAIGSARPFYRLTLNGADLTPGIELAASNRRDLSPHLHVLPADLLRTGDNVADLVLPANPALGPHGVEQLCLGPLAVLGPAFEANWWRITGLARLGLALLLALAILAGLLWWLNGRPAAYLWYIALLAALIVRMAYGALPARPGGPMLWIHIGNASLIALPYLLHGFMRAHWRYRVPWLLKLLYVFTFLEAACVALRMHGLPPASDAVAGMAFVLLVLSSALMVALVIFVRARFMHRIERRVVIGVCAFAFMVSLPETIDGWLPFAQRWHGASALAMMALAMGLGYLLVRRMAIGGYVLNAATESLAGGLDQALADDNMPPRRLWAHVTSRIGERERRRLMRDIHDGFGSRLVGVLAQARRELPHSPLRGQIQRALLDMRLMLDAMDDSSHSLGSAMARFRSRFEQANTLVADRCQWKFDQLDDVIIGNRNRLIAAYRGLEELLSEALAGAGDGPVVVAIHAGAGAVDFTVLGGAGWNATVVARIERLVRSVRGVLHWSIDTQQPRCGFTMPMF